MRYYKQEVSHFSKFYDFAISDYFMNFMKSFGHIVGVDKIYLHTKFQVNISIQYRDIGKYVIYVILFAGGGI